MKEIDIELDITDIPGMTFNKINNWCMEKGFEVEVRKGRVYVPIIKIGRTK